MAVEVNMSRFYDKNEQRFLTPAEQERDMRVHGGQPYESVGLALYDDEPEVMLLHFVSVEQHNIMLLVNGFIIGDENRLDDSAEPRLSHLGWQLSLALRTPLDVRRLEIEEWLSRGSPIGDNLAAWARTVGPKQAITPQPE